MQMENEGSDFKWGVKTGVGVGQSNRDFQYYESFTYEGSEYSLYDCAYFYERGDVETNIGKLVKLYETPNHERKVETLWLFRPLDFRYFLVDIEPRWNELFLATGQGIGLSNTNNVEKIVGKCSVVCTSKDKRNFQVSADKLSEADYFFYRTFDVGSRTVSEKFPDEIAGIKVEFLFNRIEDQNLAHPELQKPGEQFNVSSRVEQNKVAGSPAKTAMPTSRKSSLLKELEEGASVLSLRRSSASENQKTKNFPVERGTKPGRDVKDMLKVRSLGDSFTEKTEDALPLKKRPNLVDGNNSDVQKVFKAGCLGAKVIKASENPGARLASDRSLKTSKQVVEVTRRPDADRRNWFKQLPWEERLQKAQEAGTLVLLENLDPSFLSFEVEDLVWHALNEKVNARMIESTTFSSPLYGKAFVIFKSKVAAETAITELNRRYLIIADGRPVIARRRNLRVPSKATSFPGHLVIDKLKIQRQSYEARTAVSTAHCSQPNTLEYDMALQWLELQEKTDIWWRALYKKQLKEITDVKSRLKLNRSG